MRKINENKIVVVVRAPRKIEIRCFERTYVLSNVKNATSLAMSIATHNRVAKKCIGEPMAFGSIVSDRDNRIKEDYNQYGCKISQLGLGNREDEMFSHCI